MAPGNTTLVCQSCLQTQGSSDQGPYMFRLLDVTKVNELQNEPAVYKVVSLACFSGSGPWDHCLRFWGK